MSKILISLYIWLELSDEIGQKWRNGLFWRKSRKSTISYFHHLRLFKSPFWIEIFYHLRMRFSTTLYNEYTIIKTQGGIRTATSWGGGVLSPWKPRRLLRSDGVAVTLRSLIYSTPDGVAVWASGAGLCSFNTPCEGRPEELRVPKLWVVSLNMHNIREVSLG